MEYPRTSYINGKTIVLGNTSVNNTEQIDIISSNGTNIKINGVVPGAGSGALPIDDAGDIKLDPGNLLVVGDGSTTGKITGVYMEATDGNITATTGDIQTTAGDIVSGRKIFFDGDDIYHRTNNPSAETSYVTYKQLAQLNVGNTFTGANKFDDNVNEFSKKVSVGERDAGGLFTQKTAINPSGNIDCVSMNNGTAITTGTITCDNGGTNSCAAKLFTTRTSGLQGWTIEQQTAQGNPLDDILQIKGGQAGAYITINDSAFAGSVPNISLNPQTEALGGLIQTDNFRVGDGANAFDITQPKSGTDANNLLIKSGAANTPIKFQNNAGTTDLMTLELEAGTNDGLLKVPAIEFGTSGTHNRIYQLQSGATNLNLNIKQATASSEIVFQDNVDDEIIRIQKTQVEFGNTIPILFGNYSFRPQQFYKDYAGFSFNHSGGVGPTNLLFSTTDTDWTNVNTNQTGQSIDLANNPGAFKITIRQTTNGSQGQINQMRVMSDIVLSRPNDNAPSVELSQPTAYSYEIYDGTAPVITMVPGFLNWAVHCTFPGTTNNETANIRITLTRMPFFA